MTPIGSKIGTALTRTKNMPLILGVSFLLGFFSSGGSAVVDISAASYEALYSLIILIDIDSCMRQQFFY